MCAHMLQNSLSVHSSHEARPREGLITCVGNSHVWKLNLGILPETVGKTVGKKVGKKVQGLRV